MKGRRPLLLDLVHEHRITRGICANLTSLRSWVNSEFETAGQPKLTEIEAVEFPDIDTPCQTPRRPPESPAQIGQWLPIPQSELMEGYRDHEHEGTRAGPFFFTGAAPGVDPAALARDRADAEAELASAEGLEVSAKKLEASLKATERKLATLQKAVAPPQRPWKMRWSSAASMRSALRWRAGPAK